MGWGVSLLTHPFDGFLLLRCNLDVVDRGALFARGPHLTALPEGFVQHLDKPLLMLIDLLKENNHSSAVMPTCSARKRVCAHARTHTRARLISVAGRGHLGVKPPYYLQELWVLLAQLLQQS